jgi:hypothetical protein
MAWFSHVILIGSKQDSYVSFHSAMVDLPVSDNRPEYVAMQRGFLDSLSTNVLYKLNVYFDDSDARAVDKMIGRSAHIQPIDNEALMEMVIMRYRFMFQ